MPREIVTPPRGALSPRRTGWRKGGVKTLVTCLLALTLLSGCQGQRQAPPPPPPPAVTVTRPVLQSVQVYYELNGHLEAVETVQIMARVKGFLEEVNFTDGQAVKKGDLLFRIDAREYEAGVKKAEADRLKSVAEARRARSEGERANSLFASKAISAEEAEQRHAANEAAIAVVKQQEALLESAKLDLSYTEIRAPIDGQISRTLWTKGNVVGEMGTSILTNIVSVDPLYVYFDAPERDLVEFQRAQGLQNSAAQQVGEQQVEIGVTGEPGFPHIGKIDFRENKVDPGTGTIRVRGQIPNPLVSPGNVRLLYPGLFARVRVPAGPSRTLPVIPEDALMTGQEGRYVFVVGEGNVVQKRTVSVGSQIWKGLAPEPSAGWMLAGAKTGGDVPVTSIIAIEKGLTPQDRVIVNGLTRARPGAAVDPGERELRGPIGATKK